jgi:predicted enzyme related to lactoylglutathione lyase
MTASGMAEAYAAHGTLAAMIIGTHAIIFAEDAERTRAFISDVLGFTHVDAGEGWLIFKLPPAELGIHPIEPQDSGKHELYLMCDDIDRTVEELKARGVEFAGPITEAGFGRLVTLKVPGGGELGLYQPRHAMAIST